MGMHICKMQIFWQFLAAASVVLAHTMNSSTALRDCVSGVFGSTSELRIVDPSNDTYTDARIGKKIQWVSLSP